MNKYLFAILSVSVIHALPAMDLEHVKQISMQEHEDAELARALQLSLQINKKEKNFDEELARQLQQEEEQFKSEQERRDRALAWQLQHEHDFQQPINNRPQEKTITQQLKEYRTSQQRRNNQSRLNTSTIQKPTYAAFNKNLGAQLVLSGITGRLKLAGIYHVKSNALIPKQKKWACTFHALYNSYKIEELFLGKKLNNNLFIQSCAIAAQAHESGSNLEVQTIAENLKLSPLHYLEIKNENIVTLPRSGCILYSIYRFDTPQQIAQKEQHARVQLTNLMWNDCKKVLHKNGAQCIHFIGSIFSHNIPHAVLLSVVKMNNGSKVLYILDNMNEQEDMRAQEQIRKLAEHIHKKLMR